MEGFTAEWKTIGGELCLQIKQATRYRDGNEEPSTTTLSVAEVEELAAAIAKKP